MHDPAPDVQPPVMHGTAPYEAPRPTVTERPRFRSADQRPNAKRALMFAMTPLLMVAVTIALLALGARVLTPVLTIALCFTAVLALFAAGAGARIALAILQIDAASRPAGLAWAIAAVPVGLVNALLGAFAALMSVATFSRGRQLRSHGRLQFAGLSEASAWVPEPDGAPAVEDAARAALGAEAWRKNGLTEHASVAAFARLSVDLVALGAPPSLIQAAHEDALDEMRHTRMCFSLAASLDGRAIGPSAMPAASATPLRIGTRAMRLSRLAVESLIDGALNEGLSARVVAEMSALEGVDARAREVLSAIARDEARHAAHAFEIVRWCAEEGGYVVQCALRGALAALPVELGAALTPAASGGALEVYGIPSRAREEAAFALLRPRLVARVSRLVAAA